MLCVRHLHGDIDGIPDCHSMVKDSTPAVGKYKKKEKNTI